MNFVIDLAHCSVCGSVVELRSAESEGLRFDSSWGLFSLSHARDKTETSFLSLRSILGLMIYFGAKKTKPKHCFKAIILCPLKTINLWFSLEYFQTDADFD